MPYNGAADRSCSAAPTELQGRDARHGYTTAISRAADPTAALAAPDTMASAMLRPSGYFTGARLHRCSPSQVLAFTGARASYTPPNASLPTCHCPQRARGIDRRTRRRTAPATPYTTSSAAATSASAERRQGLSDDGIQLELICQLVSLISVYLTAARIRPLDRGARRA